ncbi:Short-chain dehydrogenase [Cnuella takakiae]|uniref:Short-chain dehydrogenase n=1 Tax=Cnuella takakiae TaxID=1302690 RepID=A0A1M5IRZ2_9BACT|nr:SDR family oxidoreductase [Cnuella takakiae]OLY93961.1 short-chain dehydrogenase [Cnuella takakiae]SHG30769.1 Short-chain dehydrogenase [Cnuella takakiae]
MNIVITGGSRGLGKAIAEIFADDRRGHTIILSSRNSETLERFARELQSRYPQSRILHHAADLSVKETAQAFGKWILQHVPRVDILVNNAGTFVPGNVGDEPDGALEQMMSVNLYSAYHLTRALLPAMKKAKSGHIFNMCSIASLKAYPNGGAYSISKFALLGFSKNLREELKDQGIKVTAVMPGATYTDSWAGSGVPESRIMEAKDIALLVYQAAHLSPQATVEEIVIRPQLGDL